MDTKFSGNVNGKDIEKMLTENEIIRLVILELKSHDFELISKCNTNQTGIDILLKKNNYILLIEAKGATSSKKGTPRYGLPFDSGQALTHTSAAIYKAIDLITRHQGNDNYIVGIALPLEKNTVKHVEKVKYVLTKLGIIIFWVNDEKVIIETPNQEIDRIMNYSV